MTLLLSLFISLISPFFYQNLTLFSLMRFMRVEPLQSFSWWQEHIEKPCLKGNQQAFDLLKVYSFFTSFYFIF